MNLPEAFTGAAAAPLLALLDALAGRVAPESMDEIWLFPPRSGGPAPTGIVVASVYDDDAERRRVFTAHFVPEPVPPQPAPTAPAGRRGAKPPEKPKPLLRETVAEHGSTPAERIGRLIEGVLRRLDEAVAQAEPHQWRIERDVARWQALRAALQPSEEGAGADEAVAGTGIS